MKETSGPLLLGIFQNIIAPNIMVSAMLFLSWIYYQSAMEGGSPTWRAVAVGSMAIIGTLAGLGYRNFMGTMHRMQEEAREDRLLRDRQHKANVSAIIALALAGQDKDKIEEVIEQLLKASA